ncbi:DUF3667 domain-containing protein [Luteimonas terricola]|uniref:DUF3667 domain-containing protein n=1 Tax=Luteimonas terricola TaxID=645597 RepID=A0ABQ2ECX0_9GAMM|nr:DUF3667 domain-containing protein [Luteimonas terricola]GGK03584.1 hypothetical protein GCM10011394_10780 [Luteimonas terricola]
MSDQGTRTDTDHAPARCENCAAVLHGEFCHACGQSMHNPIRHFGHAVEEFFEAFWHLDGRVFRTLRDLWFPGRVAINYLAGHRARYIAPLRLFVILSVLTFFIGAVAVHVDDSPIGVTGIEEIRGAATVEDVERIRDEMVAEIEAARAEAGNTPGVDPALIAAEVRIQGAAANRLVELTGRPPAEGTADVPAADGKPGMQINLFGHKGAWDAETNPLVVSWWPDFANNWLNRKVGNLDKNMRSLDAASPDTWVQGIMSSAPSALFLLVPVFALLLKVAYLFTRRVYLEHLVVALYSHVFLLIMLTLAFVLSALDNWVGTGVSGIVFGLGLSAIVIWMPVYLLLMQRRVYRQAWWLTVLKYLVIGNIYFMMLTVATVLMFLARLTAA